MVTIAEALQQTEQAEASALERERQIKEAETRAGKIRVGGTVTEQLRFGAGLGEARRQARQEREQAFAQIGIAREELTGFRGAIIGGQQQIQSVQAQQRQVKAFNRDLAVAKKFVAKDRFPSGESKQVRELFREIRGGGAPGQRTGTEGFVGISTLEGQGLVPIGGSQIFFPQSVPTEQFAPISTVEGPGFAPLGGAEVFVPLGTAIGGGLLVKELPSPRQRPDEFGGIQDVQEQDFDFTALPRTTPTRFQRAERFIGRQRERGDLPFFSIQAGVIAGLATTGVQTAEFGLSLFREPIGTIKGTGRGLLGIARDPFTFIGAEVSQAVADPGFAGGRVLGEVLLFKGAGKVVRAGETGFELGRTVVSSKFKPVTTRELTQFGTTERFISGLPEVGGVGEIAIIPSGLERAAPTIRPSVRGGFGFSQAEQKALLKQSGPLVTAQADFPSSAFGIPLKKELFATPPFQGIGFARESRLGLTAQKEATLSDILNFDFTFKRAKPSIIAFPERKGFDLIATPGSELEVVAPIGRIPKRTGQPGVSIIGGRRVTIVTAELAETSKETAKLFGRARAGDPLSFAERGQLRKVTGFDISRTLETRPFVSPTGFFTSLGVSISKQLRSTLSISPKSLGVSISPRISTRPGRTGKVTPRGRPSPRADGFTFRPSPPPRIDRGVRGFTGGLSGLPTIGIIEGFGAPGVKIDVERKRVKKKKKKVKRRPRFPISVSFTAEALNLRGLFPKTTKIGGVDIGILPSQIRFKPLLRAPRRPSLAGVRTRRVTRKKRK